MFSNINLSYKPFSNPVESKPVLESKLFSIPVESKPVLESKLFSNPVESKPVLESNNNIFQETGKKNKLDTSNDMFKKQKTESELIHSELNTLKNEFDIMKEELNELKKTYNDITNHEKSDNLENNASTENISSGVYIKCNIHPHLLKETTIHTLDNIYYNGFVCDSCNYKQRDPYEKFYHCLTCKSESSIGNFDLCMSCVKKNL